MTRAEGSDQRVKYIQKSRRLHQYPRGTSAATATGYMRLRALAIYFGTVTLLVHGLATPTAAGSYVWRAGSQSTPRLVRTESGTKGFQQGGVYVIEDPRTSFHYPDDDKVIVSFEWEGTPGTHHFEGRWKNPEGKVVVLSDLEYEAMGRRFGAYWTLTLNDSVKPGLWALEAFIDGQLAGMHAFQILAAPDPDLTTAAARRLAPSEIYREAASAAVVIRKFDAKGELLESGAGFYVGPNLILTTFQVINDAHSLEMIRTDEERSPVTDVVTWDRKKNWAFLNAPVQGLTQLPLADGESSAVGDRCFTLNSEAGGSWVIQEARIIGTQESPHFGERLKLDVAPDWTAAGAPVLNERGEVIGILAMRDPFPGASLMRRRAGSPSLRPDLRYSFTGTFLPVATLKLPEANAPATKLAALSAQGEFVPSVVPNQHIVGGELARKVEKRKKQAPELIGEGFEFSRADSDIVLMVTWNPREEIKSTLRLDIYDMENQLLVQSKETTNKLKAYVYAYDSWTIGISRLPPGIYRADVLSNEEPIFRTFFKIIN